MDPMAPSGDKKRPIHRQINRKDPRATMASPALRAMAKGVLVCGPEISSQFMVVVGSWGSGP